MNLQTKRKSAVVATFDIYKIFSYNEHRNLKEVVETHAEALGKLGDLVEYTKPPSANGGRPSIGYLLNIDQLLMLTALTKNSKKSDLKTEIIAAIIKSYSMASVTAIADIIESMDVDELPADRYVYVAKESESGRFKIGISSDPERRIKELNTGNPEQLVLVHAYLATDPGHKSEMIAHAIYESERLHGEWFGESIDLNLLPSYTEVCVAAENYGECDCKECTDASDIAHALIGLEPMSRDAFISEAIKKTKLSFDICARNVTELEDMGCIDYV